MLLQISLSQISMLIRKFITVEESFEREFNNVFNNLIIAIQLPKRQIKDSRYLEAATDSLIGILIFFVRISEKYL